jgi:hypothetical protein
MGGLPREGLLSLVNRLLGCYLLSVIGAVDYVDCFFCSDLIVFASLFFVSCLLDFFS